jgi:hypothetical protein
MKLAPVAFCAALLLTASIHAGPPAVTADKAAKLAQEQLVERGLAGQHYISSVTLERTSFTSKAVYWLVKFTPSISHGDRQELGVEVGMDGSVTRLVNKAAKKKE